MSSVIGCILIVTQVSISLRTEKTREATRPCVSEFPMGFPFFGDREGLLA